MVSPQQRICMIQNQQKKQNESDLSKLGVKDLAENHWEIPSIFKKPPKVPHYHIHWGPSTCSIKFMENYDATHS